MAGPGLALTRLRIPKSAFDHYLRTGIVSLPCADDVELKFNPWHDPKTGRFTFGNGRTWQGGGFTGGGGGSFGGAGETGSWGDPARAKPHPKRSPVTPAKRPAPGGLPVAIAAASSGDSHTVVSNGYVYRIDDADRTRQVTGTLTLNPDHSRSRTAQSGAGGADRLPTDDGGHYIARRFDGPTDDFNHFAQDANFNRSGYKALENKWAGDVKSGKSVWVNIMPEYSGASQRPSSIEVRWTVNGQSESQSFPNSSKGKSHGKR